MELEFHQLELRYERLRVRQPARERRLLASLADAGQQMPIVVVTAGSTLRRGGWPQTRPLPASAAPRHGGRRRRGRWPEAEALIFRQLLHTDATDSAFEQGWLLRTLHEEHGLALDALARRFDRSVSWVSRRLSLVRTLPEADPAARPGRPARRARRDEVPRAVGARQRDDCRAPRRGDRAASAQHPTNRPALSGLRHRARRHARARADRPVAGAARHRRHAARRPCGPRRPRRRRCSPTCTSWAPSRAAPIAAFSTAAACCRRSATRAWRLFDQVQTDFHDLQRRCEQELRDARSGTANGDLELTREGPRDSPDRPGPADLPWDGPDGAHGGQPDGAAD